MALLACQGLEVYITPLFVDIRATDSGSVEIEIRIFLNYREMICENLEVTLVLFSRISFIDATKCL